MVKIIKNVSFKNNNIGQVILPIFWDVDAQNYVNSLTISTNETKQRAINVFVKALKSASLWSKISKIQLPILGYADGVKNLKNPSDLITLPNDTSIATYDTNGITLLKGWSGTLVLPSRNNFHLGFYNPIAITSTVDSGKTGLALSSSEVIIGRQVTTGKNAGITWNGTLSRNVVPNRMNSAGAIIASNNSSLQLTLVSVNAEISETIQTYSGATANTPIVLGANVVNNTTTLLGVPMALFTIGSALTAQELIIYDGLQTELITILKG